MQYDIGIIYIIKEKYNLAEIHFKKALSIDSDFMPALNALGVAFLEQKQWDKSIKCFKNCADSLLYETPHYALANLGWAYLGKKSYAIAKDYFSKAMKIVPYYSRALHGYVTVCLETNSESIAIEKLNKALVAFPDSMIVNYDLASIYEKLGQKSEAEYYWKKVLSLAPEGSKFLEDAEKRIK